MWGGESDFAGKSSRQEGECCKLGTGKIILMREKERRVRTRAGGDSGGNGGGESQ